MYILVTVVVVAVITAVLWKVLKKQRMQAGITGWVLTQDLDGNSKKVYRDRKNGISSKPDIVERKKVIEVKSATADIRARWVDILQLAMEMQTSGKRQGELRYANKRFLFKWQDSEIRAALRHALAISEKMRWHLRSRIAPPATPSDRRCAVCKFGAECPESLAK